MIPQRYVMRLQKWMRYASGSSYQHVRQGQGKHFQPGTITGYYNDLTRKADWKGAIVDGVPVVRTDTLPAFFFPIVIFQWGLGNWDLWLESANSDQTSLSNALHAARWAVNNMSPEGGWACWTGLVRPTISPYSAMAQGEGISLLVRAAQVENAGEFMEVARRAAAFMLCSGDHGLMRDHGGWSSFEEYPGDWLPGVLNGWVFALFGLYDLSISTLDRNLGAAIDRYVGDLSRAIGKYDNGYWSNYDLSGNIASPFYHDLHITQLNTLALAFPSHGSVLTPVAERFDGYRQSRINRAISVIVKVKQKLLQPGVGEMA